MKSSVILTLTLAAIALAQSGHDAPIVLNNPSMATYQAILQTDKPVQGRITGVSNDNGTGVNFNINFYDFPAASEGPFSYHVHELPVPADGNCTGTGGHLDPYNRTEVPPCDPANPSNCQVGDLSGKHGKINDTATAKNFQPPMYLDLFLATQPDMAAFFGNRSVVVHARNATRLNCGNFTKQDGGTSGGNGTSTSGNTTVVGTATIPPSSATGTASGIGISSSASGSATATATGTNAASAGVQEMLAGSMLAVIVAILGLLAI